MDKAEIILASASTVRAKMLRAAGLAIRVEPAGVDEEALKHAAGQQGATVRETALMLAETKAQKISLMVPDKPVIGADQMLECDGQLLDKPADMAMAAEQLRYLRGKSHSLISAVAVFVAGQRQWAHADTARLRMRPFSDAFLTSYLDRAGPIVCQSVGAYQLEGLGSQLFDRIDGDYFTVLGLPLLALLGYLRQAGTLAS